MRVRLRRGEDMGAVGVHDVDTVPIHVPWQWDIFEWCKVSYISCAVMTYKNENYQV